MKNPAACPRIRTSCALPLVVLLSLLSSGCHKAVTQIDIEWRICAVPGRYDAEYLESLLQQAPDPAKAANLGIEAVMYERDLPPDIEKCRQYYQPREMHETPKSEYLEVLNRYRISMLDVLVRYGGNLNTGHQRLSCHWLAPMTPELLAWLLERGYDPDLPCQDNHHSTVLSHCVSLGQTRLTYDQKYEMIKMLLEHGVRPDVLCGGRPILQRLLTIPDDPHLMDILKMLLKAADDKGIEGYGDSALITAFEHRQPNAALVLLEHATRIDMADQFGNPLINIAAGAGHATCVELLIARGANVNAVGSRGYTPLHAAAAAGNEEIITVLMQAGAAVNPLNKKGQTPLDVAQIDVCGPRDKDRTQKVIDLLISRGAKRAAELNDKN